MTRSNSAVSNAAAALRQLILATESGAFLGSEEALGAKLGASRSTVRQVARLLEREGLLFVRRGINGGYFSARPNPDRIQGTVTAYLEALNMDGQDVTAIGLVLWIEVVRKAATQRPENALPDLESLQRKIRRLKTTATFSDVSKLEREVQQVIFDMLNARYIQLIFQINMDFATRRTTVTPEQDHTEQHRKFVRDWREAKLTELEAIQEGDVDLAVSSAGYLRSIWHRRLWQPSMGIAGGENPDGA